MRPGYLQNLDVLGLTRHDYFLSAVLNIDVIWSWAHPRTHVLTAALPEFGFHASEGNVGLGYFVLMRDLKVIRPCIWWVVPGPTFRLGLTVGFGLSFLKTKAINFIIMDYWSTTDNPALMNNLETQPNLQFSIKNRLIFDVRIYDSLAQSLSTVQIC